jgi:enoyl-CoA hydratase/carnithine racemase
VSFISDEILRVDRHDDGIAVVVLNRPEHLNALDQSLLEAVRDTFESLREDRSVRVVIVTGQGRAFCARFDLHALGPGSGPPSDLAGATEWMQSVQRGPLALYQLEQPTIAAVNGAAAGGGLGLALGCDLRIAAPSATFSAPFVRMGLGPDFGCAGLLPRIVGMTRAMEILLSARRVGAEEALAIGLASRIADDPLAASLALAREIAAMPAEGPARVKAMVRAAATADHVAVLTEIEPRGQAAALVHPDFRALAASWLAAARGVSSP